VARLLLVTRSMALSLRLADAHDVVERGDDDLDSLTPTGDIDLIVLDVAGPEQAVETVRGMRSRDIATPVLIVSGYQPEWASLLSLSMPGVAVVALPITRASLLDGISRLLHPTAAENSPAPPAEPTREVTAPSAAARQLPRAGPVPPPTVSASTPTARHPEATEPRDDPAAAEAPSRRFPLGRRPAAQPEASADAAGPPTGPVPRTGSVPRVDPPDLVLGDDYDPFFATAPHGLDDLQPEGASRPPDLALVAMVQQLIERSTELYGVPDTAQVLADEIVERADADAAAVLIPDGAIWRVSAGVGLRPLERRLVLDSSHWLIAESALQGRALLIEDTDIVRQKIAGAPLAAWRHLMCLPLLDLRSAVVVARGAEAGPFTERDLAAVIDPIREATALLDRALDVRRLARLLAPLRDADDRRGR
jgi:CheY-like chemotaxis protein